MALPDPLSFGKSLWPDVELYSKQREIVYSVEHDDETYVPAGNQLGKDFVAAYVILVNFLRHTLGPAPKGGEAQCRIVTTSATENHLSVLWAEIDRLISTCLVPLKSENGGPLYVRHFDIRRFRSGEIEERNYIFGLVRTSDSRGEGLQGHHAAWTLGVVDEASGSSDVVYKMLQGWAKRLLIFGNPHQCENFFKRGVEAGDMLAT